MMKFRAPMSLPQVRPCSFIGQHGETVGPETAVDHALIRGVASNAAGDCRNRKSLSVKTQDLKEFSKLDQRRRSLLNHLEGMVEWG
ncbi:hypothetical protein [Mesorhizobium sp.]|uniref:hypothetical protein n=1 Tax=Mesorhizobium sp. TaxID=1871066 RepID=UPI00257DE68D|nr:hypothetical protein [Mesorhizobium sp.]